MAARHFRWLLLLFTVSPAACRDKDPVEPGTEIPKPADPRYALRISPDSAVLLVGDSLQLRAAVTDSQGRLIDTARIAWRSTDTTVVNLAVDGRAIGRKLGTAFVIATGNGAADTVGLRVVLVQGCSATGVMHTGSIDVPTTWAAAQSPHFIQDSVIVKNTLTVEAGAIVCALPKSSIRVRGGTFQALGRADRRIQLLATDTVQGWLGVGAGGLSNDPGGTIRISYADVLYGGFVSSGYISSAEIDHSSFRRTAVGNGGANFSTFSIRHSVVEDASVSINAGSFEETTIRRGMLQLISAQGSGAVSLNGGRIEDSPGVALTIGSTFSFRVPNVTAIKAPVITGSRGGIATMPPANFFALWPTATAQAVLLDNVNRTVSLWSLNYGDLSLRAGIDWSLAGIVGVPIINSLTIDAGANVTFASPGFSINGPTRAVGTAAMPIRIASPGLVSLNGTAASRLSYVTFQNTFLSVGEQNVAQLDHIDTNAPIGLAAPGSVISDSHIHDVGAESFGDGALILGADSVTAQRVVVRIVRGRSAVRINGRSVRLLACEITDNSDDAVLVTGGSNIEVQECALERNVGLGIRNQTSAMVNAQRNWWGDPSGPSGVAGDGVAGPVDFSNQLITRPVTLTARATRVVITRSPSSLPTSDTTRFAAVAFDSAGQPISQPLVWSTADNFVAFVAPNEDGLLVGAHTGATTVTVRSATDPTVSATAQLTVTPGAPLYRWTREPVAVAGAGRISAANAAAMYTVAAGRLLRRENASWNAVPNVTIAGSGLLSVAPTGQVFVQSDGGIGYYDGSSFRTLAPLPTPYPYEFAATGADELYFASDKGRLWRYRNGRVDLVFSDSTLGNASVWARSPNEVYFLAVDFNDVQNIKTRILKWDGAVWTRLPDLPGNATSVAATDRYVFAGGYRFDGTRWELLPGNTSAYNYDAFPISDSFVVLRSGARLALFDGVQIRTLWAGERLPSIAGLWAIGNEIFIASGRDFILRGQPE